MPVNYARLVELFRQKDGEEAVDILRESMSGYEPDRQTRRRPDVNPYEVELGRLFEECFGWSEFQACRRGGRDYLATHVMERALTEAEGAVSTSAFLNITGQIVYSMVLDKYQNTANVFTPLIPEVQTAFLDGEKAAGVTQIGDEVQVRNESDPYQLAGVGEDWIFTPVLKDRGMVVPVTWEAIFADRTGQLQERCSAVGEWGGINREKRAINCVIDENVTAHRYNWRGTVIASYGDNSGTHTWDNLAASNGLTDWQNVNTVEQLFNEMLDPYTSEPIDIEPVHLVVTKQLEQTARRIVRQGTIQWTTPGYATSGNVSHHHGDNPYGSKYEVVTSKRIAPLQATDTSWFLGDIGKYAKYMQAEKPTVMQAPPNAPEEFHRRIVSQYRFNERGAYVCVQPRAMCKSTV
jgi:hypothetical protein